MPHCIIRVCSKHSCVVFQDIAIIDKFIYLVQYNSTEVAKYLDSVFNIVKNAYIKGYIKEFPVEGRRQTGNELSILYFIIPLFI